MRNAKIVHYLMLMLIGIVIPMPAVAEQVERFDPRPLVRQVQVNVSAVQALEASARGTGRSSVVRCVQDRITESRTLLGDLIQLAARMGPEGVNVAQAGEAPLDVPARGVPEMAVMVAGVKSISESSALLSAARRCFAVSEDTEIRWLPAVQSAPVSAISALTNDQ